MGTLDCLYVTYIATLFSAILATRPYRLTVNQGKPEGVRIAAPLPYQAITAQKKTDKNAKSGEETRISHADQ
jgi:hypothetical protein